MYIYVSTVSEFHSSPLQIKCQDKKGIVDSICANMFESNQWRRNINRKLSDSDDDSPKYGKSSDDMHSLEDIMTGIRSGIPINVYVYECAV